MEENVHANFFENWEIYPTMYMLAIFASIQPITDNQSEKYLMGCILYSGLTR